MLVVPDVVQAMDLIIGRSFTEITKIAYARKGDVLHFGYAIEEPFKDLQFYVPKQESARRNNGRAGNIATRGCEGKLHECLRAGYGCNGRLITWGYDCRRGKVKSGRKKIQSANFRYRVKLMRCDGFWDLSVIFRRFVEDLAQKAAPFIQLTTKEETFDWRPSESTAFNLLRKTLRRSLC